MSNLLSQPAGAPTELEGRRRSRFRTIVWVVLIASALLLVAALVSNLAELPAAGRNGSRDGVPNETTDP